MSWVGGADSPGPQVRARVHAEAYPTEPPRRPFQADFQAQYRLCLCPSPPSRARSSGLLGGRHPVLCPWGCILTKVLPAPQLHAQGCRQLPWLSPCPPHSSSGLSPGHPAEGLRWALLRPCPCPVCTLRPSGLWHRLLIDLSPTLLGALGDVQQVSFIFVKSCADGISRSLARTDCFGVLSWMSRGLMRGPQTLNQSIQ